MKLNQQTLTANFENIIIYRTLTWALLIGVLIRILTALLNVGFFAYDDYYHVIEPAWRLYLDTGFDWKKSGLPGSAFRSYLFFHANYILILFAKALQIDSSKNILRFIYLFWGIVNALGIIGIYRLSTILLDRTASAISTWLYSMFFLLPFIGTRTMPEAVSMVPLIYSTYFIEKSILEKKYWFAVAAGIFLVIACSLRPQVGIWAISLLAVLLYQKKFKIFTYVVIASCLSGLLIGFYDLFTRNVFLGSVFEYLSYNNKYLTHVSSQPWYTLLLFSLALTLPPASIYFIPALLKGLQNHLRISVPLVSFITIHSFISHKEERFLFPIIWAIFFSIAVGDQIIRKQHNRLYQWLLKQRRWSFIIFLTLSIGCSLIILTGRSQDAVLNAFDKINQYKQQEIILYRIRPKKFFLSSNNTIQAVSDFNHISQKGDFLLLIHSFYNASLKESQKKNTFECKQIEHFEGWWIDRMLYTLNPQGNKRRSPLDLLHCHSNNL